MFKNGLPITHKITSSAIQTRLRYMYATANGYAVVTRITYKLGNWSKSNGISYHSSFAKAYKELHS